MSPAVTIEDLSVRYPTGRQALSGLSLTVAQGACVALVGESGSGKTTVVRAVLGLLPPGTVRSGRIQLGGRDLSAASERQLRRLRGTAVGYVAQDPYGACDPVWTVGHHVAEAWYAHRLRPARGEVARRLARLGVASMRRRRPYAWSGGMLQRATVAAATTHEPALVVADEPTSALDAELADDVLRLLRQQARALLLVTHDLDLAARHCDRLLVLHDGQIIEELPAETPRAAPEVSRVAAVRTPPAPAAATVAAAAPVAAELAGVTLRAGRRRTLAENIDLAVRRGEIVGVVGPSGVGKTTLLHTLAGLRPVAAGTVSFGGQPAPPPGYVMPIFQDAAASLDPRWPIRRTVTEPLAVRSPAAPMGRDAMHATVTELLARVGLSTVDPESRPAQLSGGQQQRVAIARALAARPALLIADEPVSRLDPAAAAGVCTLLREVADAGTAIVVASHDRPRLASLADRLVRLESDALVHIPMAEAMW